MRKALFLSENTKHRVGRGILLLLALIAIIGLGDAFLIHLKEIAAKTDPSVFESCNLSSVISCGRVATSQYATMFGIPVSLIGIMFYEGILILAGTLLLGFELPDGWKLLVSGIITVSLVFSLRLLYYSYLGLGAICPYCAVSNITTALIALTWFWYLKQKAVVYTILSVLVLFGIYVFLLAGILASRF